MAACSSCAAVRQRPRYEDDPSPQLIALLRQAFRTFTPTPINWCKAEMAVKDVHRANHQEQHDAFCREYFELTAESLIRFMRAEGMLPPAEPKPTKKKKPFRNITQCLLHLMGTAGGRERIEACGRLQDVCDYIHEEYSEQPATPQLLKAPGAWPSEEAGGMKWRWDKKKQQPTRTVAPASRLGEHFDLDGFQTRRPQPAARPAAASFECAECREPIVGADCLQVRGKLYCRECGDELQSRTIPRPR